LVFRGSRDGWSAKIIHSKIDGQGPTITIIKTRKGKIFGGFASVSWEPEYIYNSYPGPIKLSNTETTKLDNDSFLFSVDLAVKNPANLNNAYISCQSDTGPEFGGYPSTSKFRSYYSVFKVPANANTDKSSFSYVCDCYKDLPKAANG
jgi:hypothetical protein